MKNINLTREEAMKLPIMKYVNETGYYINLSLQEINKLMGFNLKRDSAIANRLLGYKVNGIGVFATFEYSDQIRIVVNSKVINPDFDQETVFDISSN